MCGGYSVKSIITHALFLWLRRHVFVYIALQSVGSSVPVPELATNQRCRFPVEIDKVARGLNFRKLLGQRCERFIHLEIRFENGRQYSRMISIFVFVELKMLRRGFSQRSSMDLRFTGFWITCALTMLSITGRFQVGYISQFLP